jgi:hypothetical protein
MLEKFDNRQSPEEAPEPAWRRKWQPAVILIILILSILAGAGAFLLNGSVTRTVKETSSFTVSALRRHFAHGISKEAVKNLFEEIRTGKSPSLHDNSATDSSAEFIYTIELKDGGRVEGRTITVGKDKVTVTDDMGVAIEVTRDRIARITRMRM